MSLRVATARDKSLLLALLTLSSPLVEGLLVLLQLVFEGRQHDQLLIHSQLFVAGHLVPLQFSEKPPPQQLFMKFPLLAGGLLVHQQLLADHLLAA